MYRNLSEFIARLEREGELQRVSVPVDPVYEIAEITDRMSKQPDGGKALLFEQTGTPFPVLTNMMGSDRRMTNCVWRGALVSVAGVGVASGLSPPMPPVSHMITMASMISTTMNAAKIYAVCFFMIFSSREFTFLSSLRRCEPCGAFRRQGAG